jgi:hypothetical protein
MLATVDPNLFHLDWDRTIEVLFAVAVVSVLLERSLSLVFEHRRFVDSRFDKGGLKELIAYALSFCICRGWSLDAISIILLSEQTTLLGEAITAGVVAGGAKASVKVFRDLWKIRSAAYAESREPGGRADVTGATDGATK